MSTKQVFDASALISLALAERLETIESLEIFAPPAVLRELEEMGRHEDMLADSARKAIAFVEKKVPSLKEEFARLADCVSKMPRLGRGEAEVLALAHQLGAEELVIDDIRAMGSLLGIAKILGIEIVPSSYLIVKAYLQDILEYDEAISTLNLLADRRGRRQNVVYDTAIVMEEAKRAKEKES